MCSAKAVPQAVGVQPSVHVVMGDPLLSRATELYREGLIEAGVEGCGRLAALRFTWWWRLRPNRRAQCKPRLERSSSCPSGL